MQKQSTAIVGAKLVEGGESLNILSPLLANLDLQKGNASMCGQRMSVAAAQMVLAGQELQGVTPEKTKGKSWLKA
jgi:hypothetical protein